MLAVLSFLTGWKRPVRTILVEEKAAMDAFPKLLFYL